MNSGGAKEGLWKNRFMPTARAMTWYKRPAIRDDEPMKLKANMNMTVHPIAASKTAFAWV
jgi:hypothetical protein